MGYFNQIKGLAKADGMPERLSILIAAQCSHETADFTSSVFRRCGNLNGYKWVPPNGSRWQDYKCSLSPEGNAYGGYNTIEKSVHELTDWIKRRVKEGRFPLLQDIRTPELYARYLKKCGYFGAPESEYVAGLKRAIQRHCPAYRC